MTGLITLDQLAAAASDDSIDTVLVCFPDMFGRLVGKRFDASFFVDEGFEETHACDYLLADDIDMEPVPGYEIASWEKGYGDFVMKPDLATLRVVPWLEATAMVLCDVLGHATHDPAIQSASAQIVATQSAAAQSVAEPRAAAPHSPRAILKRQIDRLDSMGFTAMTASELEFYLFDESYRTIHNKGYRNPKTSGYYIQDYHILQTTKEEPVLRAMRRGLRDAGIPVENSKGEWGPGQEELNIRYADALTMADRHVIMKNGMKEIAHAHGKAITFMAKWNYALAGSSCHVHLSLRAADGTPIFHDPSAEYGMSATMRAFVAGQLEHAAATTYFLAPFINSYKRFQVGTFAPTRIVWSRDNRTAGFRLCGENSKAIRIECRIGGADLNPYLAFAALIAAGIDGVERNLPLDPPFAGDAYHDTNLTEIPKTLRAATDQLNRSTMLREAFGNDVVDHYLHTARCEQLEYDRRVTDWELRRGFEQS